MKSFALILLAAAPWASGWTDLQANQAVAWTVQDEPAEDPEEGKKDKHLKEWPALENKAAAAKEVKRLVKARTEQMGLDAAINLKEIGAGVAPSLLKALGITRDKETEKRMTYSHIPPEMRIKTFEFEFSEDAYSDLINRVKQARELIVELCAELEF